jgi:hypothetical protein
MNEKRNPRKPETRGPKNTPSFPNALWFPCSAREQAETVSGKCEVVSQRFRLVSTNMYYRGGNESPFAPAFSGFRTTEIARLTSITQRSDFLEFFDKLTRK